MSEVLVSCDLVETQTPPAASLDYRPAIDGLRSIAVLSVVIFHLSPRLLPGGFVGVDIFFVISGFLITKILLRDCTKGSFSFARFYQRRIARLFPSLFLVALVTFAATSFFFEPKDLANSGKHMVCAVVSYANFGDLSEKDGYFGVTKDSHPYLQYWSLSVEEQFYLLFPALLLAIFRFAQNRVQTILKLLFAISLLACVLITLRNPSWAFYMLPTRAWELLAGSICAVKAGNTTSRYSRVSDAWGWAGLLLFALSFALVREANFPGYLAILPVAGAVAVIGRSSSKTDSAERFLSSAPLVLIGRMSYSLYLCHWPVFCVVDYALYTSSEVVRLSLKLGLTILATALTFFLVEHPARVFLNNSHRRKTAFGFAALMLAITIPLGIWVRQKDFIDAQAFMLYPDRTMIQRARTRLFLLTHASGTSSVGGLAYNSKGRHESLILMGDSHASMLGTMLRDLAIQDDLRLSVISMSGEDPLPGGKNKDAAWLGSLAAVERAHPDYLIIEDEWGVKLHSNPQRLARSLDALRPYARQIILITQPPILPPEGSREGIRNGAHPPFRELEVDCEKRSRANAVVKSMAMKGVTVIDSDLCFRNPDGTIPFADSLGRQLYYDASHLSRYGADRLRPRIQSLLRP